MSLFIFTEYTELRRRHPEWMIKAKDLNIKKEEEHKATIVLDMILKYIHRNKELLSDEDDIDIKDMKLIDFSQRIQKMVKSDSNKK